MTGYVPPARLLHGVPYPVAECYGKPHLGCSYRVAEFPAERKAALRAAHTHRLDPGAACVCCGMPASNAHHCPPLGTAVTFRLRGHLLRPALFAVCGSGTTGCHDGWHGGARFKALWMWDSEQYAREWWEGSLVSDAGPHSPELFLYGCWELYDMEQGRIWRERR